MRISVRGWARDMGEKVLFEKDLSEMNAIKDRRQTIRRDEPGLFKQSLSIVAAWFQTLRHMGDYRMEVELSDKDIMHLFKAAFGSELRPWLIDEEGFTVSDELAKRALGTLKLADLTLGDLAAMQASAGGEDATAEKLVDPVNIRPFRRRL